MEGPELYKEPLFHVEKAFAEVGETGIYMTDGLARTMRVNRAYETLTEIEEREATLLLGESGVGKEVVARIIHQLSGRRHKPFIKVNLGAIPEDLFESEMFGYRAGAFTGTSRSGKIGLAQAANGGTLFLDEVCEAPLSVQVKLLRLLQEKEILPVGSVRPEQVDIRFIAASNRDPHAMMLAGKFREDLYYRLNVVPIRILPLRERQEDVYALVQHFLHELNHQYRMDKQLAPQALQELMAYSWPGNVRELKNLVERLAVLSPQRMITREMVVNEFGSQMCIKENSRIMVGPKSRRKATADFEKQLIQQLLDETGSMEKAARMMGIHRTTLLRKARKYGIVYIR